jgi:hypothetical protein
MDYKPDEQDQSRWIEAQSARVLHLAWAIYRRKAERALQLHAYH